MERTFDHGSKLQNLDHSHHVTLTEGQSQRSGLGFRGMENRDFLMIYPIIKSFDIFKDFKSDLILI
jgi:hypothetical protein